MKCIAYKSAQWAVVCVSNLKMRFAASICYGALQFPREQLPFDMAFKNHCTPSATGTFVFNCLRSLGHLHCTLGLSSPCYSWHYHSSFYSYKYVITCVIASNPSPQKLYNSYVHRSKEKNHPRLSSRENVSLDIVEMHISLSICTLMI